MCCGYWAIILLSVVDSHFFKSFQHGYRKEMQSTPASGRFISKWQEALVGNGKLALNPFGWRKIWTADLLLLEQVWHLAERQYQLTCKNKHSLSCKAKSYNTCLERDPLHGFCMGLCRGVLS